MRPTTRLILAAVLLALAAPACRARHEAALRIETDGSGSFSVGAALDADGRRVAAESGEDPFAPFRASALAPDAPPGTRSEEWSQGDFEGVRIVTPFRSPGQLEELFADGSGEDGMVRVHHTGDRIEITFDAPAFAAATVEEPLASLAADPAVTALVPDGALDDLVDLRFTLHVEGRVVEHNADRMEPGGVLVWRLHPTPRRPFRVVADLNGDTGRTKRPGMRWMVATAATALVGTATVSAVRARGIRR